MKVRHLCRLSRIGGNRMASGFDIAAYILDRQGPMSTWKLQKLVYYSQAWSLVWDDDVLFPEEFEARANGPVARELYTAHRGQYRVSQLDRGSPEVLSEIQQETVGAVLKFYGDKSPQWLSDLTHMQAPWQDAGRGILDGVRRETVISKESLAEYNGSL